MSIADEQELRAAGAHEWMIDALARIATSKGRTLDGHLVCVGEPQALAGTAVTARCHFVAGDGGGNILVPKLARMLATQIVEYCIPPSRIAQARAAGSTAPVLALQEEARELFTTLEHSGEAGELLLYLLLETVLGLPQLMCKMSLKSNSKMHVHGADGIHGAIGDDGKLALYWGESKLHARVKGAVDSCIEDLAPYLLDDGSGRTRLTANPLFGKGSLGLELTPRGDGTFDTKAIAPVDWEQLRGATTYFRRAWMNDEPTFVARLRNRLRENAQARGGPDSEQLVEWLDELGKEFSTVKRNWPADQEGPAMAILEGPIEGENVVDDVEATPERVINDWFNGEIFHGDAAARARLDLAGDADAYVFALMVAIQEVTRVYVLLGRSPATPCASPGCRKSGAKSREVRRTCRSGATCRLLEEHHDHA